MSFWTLIFALSMAFIVALVVTTLLKVQAGFQPPEASDDGLTAREAEAIRAENERLRQQVSDLTERLIVLERIATDSAERVSSEIEKLR
jgi:uncharacterized protein YlxW (UPF0749 family)